MGIEPNRREFLAAAPALALLTAGPAIALAAPSQSSEWLNGMWALAMRRYEVLKAEHDACAKIHDAAYYGGTLQRDSALADRMDDLSMRLSEAEGALMDIPAPDLRALRWKLDMIFDLDPDGGMQPWTFKYVGQTIADYKRLLGDA